MSLATVVLFVGPDARFAMSVKLIRGIWNLNIESTIASGSGAWMCSSILFLVYSQALILVQHHDPWQGLASTCMSVPRISRKNKLLSLKTDKSVVAGLKLQIAQHYHQDTPERSYYTMRCSDMTVTIKELALFESGIGSCQVFTWTTLMGELQDGNIWFATIWRTCQIPNAI